MGRYASEGLEQRCSSPVRRRLRPEGPRRGIETATSAVIGPRSSSTSPSRLRRQSPSLIRSGVPAPNCEALLSDYGCESRAELPGRAANLPALVWCTSGATDSPSTTTHPDPGRRGQARSTAPAHTQTSCWWGGAPNLTRTARLVQATAVAGTSSSTPSSHTTQAVTGVGVAGDVTASAPNCSGCRLLGCLRARRGRSVITRS